MGLGFISNWEGMKKPYGNLLFYKTIKYIIYVFIIYIVLIINI